MGYTCPFASVTGGDRARRRARTPVSVLPHDYDSDPGRFLAVEEHPHDDVHPYVARRFAATGAARLDLPLTLTARGCVAYAVKAA
jgi:hypothetical protein